MNVFAMLLLSVLRFVLCAWVPSWGHLETFWVLLAIQHFSVTLEHTPTSKSICKILECRCWMKIVETSEHKVVVQLHTKYSYCSSKKSCSNSVFLPCCSQMEKFIYKNYFPECYNFCFRTCYRSVVRRRQKRANKIKIYSVVLCSY